MTFKLLLGFGLNSLKLREGVASLNCNLEPLYMAHNLKVFCYQVLDRLFLFK